MEDGSQEWGGQAGQGGSRLEFGMSQQFVTSRRRGEVATANVSVQATPANPPHFVPPGAAPPFAPNGQPLPAGLPFPPAAAQFGVPPPGISALPTRPDSFTDPLSEQIDDLIASSAAAATAASDAAGTAAAPEKEKKAKKGKDIKMVYFDESVSPEEKMARLPRFGDFMQT